MSKENKKRYLRKRINFFELLSKIKIWPSRRGVLHGIKAFVRKGNFAIVTTHCNIKIRIRDSKNSRTARWLRNKWYSDTCKVCKVPDWKLNKYSHTRFTR